MRGCILRGCHGAQAGLGGGGEGRGGHCQRVQRVCLCRYVLVAAICSNVTDRNLAVHGSTAAAGYLWN